jgi:hypothetical protein
MQRHVHDAAIGPRHPSMTVVNGPHRTSVLPVASGRKEPKTDSVVALNIRCMRLMNMSIHMSGCRFQKRHQKGLRHRPFDMVFR